jgi:adhesin transport system outer membrane protein
LALADAASARAQTAKFQVTLAEREVSEKVSLDLVENRSARTRMESTASAAVSTRNVTESFLRQFVAGRRTWLDVMNAVREAIEARAALVEVQNSAMASAVRLQLRTCAWDPDVALGSGS